MPPSIDERGTSVTDCGVSLHETILTWLSETSTSPRAARKRHGLPLAERDSNIKLMSPQSEPLRNKRRRLAAEVADVDDPEATPRPSRRNIAKPPSTASSPIKSTTSSRSSRSIQCPKSPVKRVTDFILRPRPIVLLQFDNEDKAMPTGLTQMLVKVRQFGRGIGVISAASKVDVASASDQNFSEIDDYAFTTDPARTLYGPSPSWKFVADIRRWARQCDEQTQSEPSWNCRVHTPLLFLALDNDTYRTHVEFLNWLVGSSHPPEEKISSLTLTVSSSTAQIQPKSLIPSDHAGKPGESKMVDFAIYIEPDKVMLEAMRAMAARRPYETSSVNQTWHSPLLTRPIGVNIETKRSGEGWDSALVQSGIWLAAQFARLEQLVQSFGDLDSIPFLPVIIIQGHDWHFLAASRGENGQTVKFYPAQSRY
ncbi:MAG: hypothetical protein M1816_001361 [Peltula sp. TS41687]|nr:MAG: hypothetical protein M1816_001361 [Peltula sp. TS41687]